MLDLLVGIEEFDVVCLGEVLAEIVRRSRLQRFAVGHERLDRIRLDRAGKAFARALDAGVDWNGGDVFREVTIDAEHAQRLLACLLRVCVRGVAFLPQEFHRAQKRARGLFPAQHVTPLIDENRQIAIRFDPLRIHDADDNFRRWTNREALGELFVAAVRHPRNFRRKALHVLRLFEQQAFRNEQREVCVFMPRRFKGRVQVLLQILPQPITVWAKHHATAHRRIRC